MNYEEAIQYLYDRLPVFHFVGAAAYKPGLEKSLAMMEHLDNPHLKYRSIHVGGTNGKGSISHLLAAVLQSAGYKTGLYTSPHLLDFGERIRIDGVMIDRQYVVDFVREEMTYLEDVQPSFFEATMAMAFKYFADNKVDVAIVEVGLGGRLDSTNIIRPDLSIISNISKDHEQFLGNTLAQIAEEKAGIIKADVPAVIGERHPETEPVFLAKAKEMASNIVFAEDKESLRFLRYEGAKMLVESRQYPELVCGLSGSYQLKNIATLLVSVDELRKTGYNIGDEHLFEGLSNVLLLSGLRGRWEQVQSNPRVIVDTGHNRAAMEFLVEQLAREAKKQLRIVIGMASDKDVRAALELLPADAIYYFTAANSSRSLPAEQLASLGAELALIGNEYESVSQAIDAALRDAADADLIFVGGSNFVVGEALALFPRN